MPRSKSAQKQARQAAKRQAHNKAIRSATKTRITKVEKLIFAGEVEAARGAAVAAISSLDKAAEKKVVHPNNAARRKSRLMKKLNEAQASPLPEPAPEETEK